MKGRSRRITILTILVYCMLAVFLAITAILSIRLSAMQILPIKFLAAYVAVSLLFALILWLVRKKRVLNIIFILLALLLSAALAFAWIAVGKVDQTIKQVTTLTSTETSQLAVVVLADDAAEGPADLQNYFIGYSRELSENNLQRLQTALSEQGGAGNEYLPYEDTLAEADALLRGDIRAAAMNAAYVDMIGDLVDYENFPDQVKVILTIDILEEVEVPENTGTESESTMSGLPEEILDASVDKDTFIVYISGIDTFGDVNVKSRSDVNILAAVNTRTHQIQMVNTPRDYYVSLPVSNGIPDKLTHAGIYGIENSIGALEMLYGINVDYYVRMNFSGFVDIIDTVGGIDVYSEYDFTVEPIRHYVVGVNHLNGIEALAFARERKSFAAGDIQRGINQMAVIKAMINKMTSLESVYNYSALLDSVANCVQTNLTSGDIYGLIRLQLEDGTGWDVQSMTVTGTGDYRTTYSIPGARAYVMLPSETDIAEAKERLAAVISAE